jgi:hypothetical protein
MIDHDIAPDASAAIAAEKREAWIMEQLETMAGLPDYVWEDSDVREAIEWLTCCVCSAAIVADERTLDAKETVFDVIRLVLSNHYDRGMK